MLQRLHFGGHQVDVLETLDQWYGPTTDTSRAGPLTEVCTFFGSMNVRPNGS